MLVVVGLLFTWVLAPLVAFLVVARFLGVEDEDEALDVLLLSAGMGPITISWLLTLALRVAPGQAHALYVGLVMGVFALAAAYGRTEVRWLTQLWRRLQRWRGRLRLKETWPQVTLLAVAGFVIVQCLLVCTLPFMENDAIQYAFVSQRLVEEASISLYPFTSPDPKTGFYATSAHPLGYISLMVWTRLFQSGTEAGWIKLISPMHLLYTCALLGYVLRGRRALQLSAGVLLLVTTPIFYREASQFSIDPFRVFHYFLAFCWLGKLLQRGGMRTAAVAGVQVGLSMYCHAMGGALTGPTFALIYLALAKAPWASRLRILVLVGVVAAGVGSHRYVQNLQRFGTPVYDQLPVLRAAKNLRRAEFMRLQYRVNTWQDRLLRGLLKGWTSVRSYGLTFWFALMALLLVPKTVWADPLARVSLGVVVIYHGLVALAVGLGRSEFILGDRYLLTVLPPIVHLGSFALAHVFGLAARLAPGTQPDPRPGWRQPWRLALGVIAPHRAGIARVAVVGAIAWLCQGHLETQATNKLTNFYPHPVRWGWDDWKLLSSQGYSRFTILKALQEKTPADAKVLVYRQNDVVYYGRRRVLRRASPEMLAFYQLRDSAQGYRYLRDLGIDYILIPSYGLASYYNSVAAPLTNDPRYCRLLDDHSGYKLFELLPEAREVVYTPSDYSPERWKPAPGGAGRGWFYESALPDTFWSKSPRPWSVVERPEGQELRFSNVAKARNCVLAVGDAGHKTYATPWQTFEQRSEQPGGGRYRVTLRAEGEARLRVLAYECFQAGSSPEVRSTCVREHYLTNEPRTTITGQFQVSSDALSLRLGLQILGPGNASVTDLRLERFRYADEPKPVDRLRTRWKPVWRFSAEEPESDALQLAQYGPEGLIADGVIPPRTRFAERSWVEVSRVGGSDTYLRFEKSHRRWPWLMDSKGADFSFLPPKGERTRRVRIRGRVCGDGRFQLFLNCGERGTLRLGDFYPTGELADMEFVLRIPADVEEPRIAAMFGYLGDWLGISELSVELEAPQ